MVGGPPAPENLAGAVKFQQEIQAGTCYKVATLSAGYGVQRIEKR